MRSAIFCVVAAMSLASCGSDSVIGLFDEASLVTHRARWHGAAIHSYSFDLNQENLTKTGNVHIVVQFDVVVSVVYNDTGLPPDPASGWPTIDEIYANAALIEERGSITHFEIGYDEQYSFPSLVSAYNGRTPGPAYLAQLSNFVPAN